MGLALCLMRLAGNERPEDEPGWDGTRYAHDRKFDQWHMGERVTTMTGGYWRPSDINASRKWVQETIADGEQDRYLDLLARLEGDSDLWLYSSY